MAPAAGYPLAVKPMPWILAMLCLFCLLPAQPVAARQSADAVAKQAAFFGLTNVWTIHLTIQPAAWRTLNSTSGDQRSSGNPGLVGGVVRGIFGVPGEGPGRRVPDSYPWATCTFEAGGQTLTNVAVRFKGASSMVRAPNPFKRPFKIDFDKGVTNRRFMGIEELTFNNNVNDATQMREALAYELFRRAGLPAPRTAFARVYLTIPGRLEKQHLGLYTLIEVVEGDFLKRAVGTKEGLLLKPEMMRGIPYLGDDWDVYTERYQPKGKVDPKDTARFIQFVRFIRSAQPDQFEKGLRAYLDPEPFARFVALNALLANVDSFIGNGHNYYLHLHPATGKSTFIPWDLNEAFGMHPVSGPSGAQMITSVLRPNADPNQLIERFVADPVLGPIYRQELEKLLAEVFVPAKLHADIDRIASVTGPVVTAETRRAKEDFQRTVLETMRPDQGDTSQPRHDSEYARESYEPRGFPDAVYVDNIPLKKWITGRAKHARDQLDGKARGTRPRARLYQQ